MGLVKLTTGSYGNLPLVISKVNFNRKAIIDYGKTPMELVPNAMFIPSYSKNIQGMVQVNRKKPLFIRKSQIIGNVPSVSIVKNERNTVFINHILNYSDNSSDNNQGNKDNKDPKIDKKYLERKANLGTMVQMLQIKVPNLLTKIIPCEFMSKDIIMRILPNKFPQIPTIKGPVLYTSTLKAIQKLVLLFYLNPESKIHITNLKIIEPTNSMSSAELINLSIDENVIENGHVDENRAVEGSPKQAQDVSKYTTKIKIKWRTCYSGCAHLQDKDTTDAKLGSYSLDHFDWTKLLKSPNPLQTLEGLAKNFDPTASNDTSVGRVLTGVFIFELDANNEKISVFTIDNMEILESKEINFNNQFLAT